jgi:hypothetical protein
VTARRSERTRVIADLAWLGGLIQIALGTALLTGSEAPIVAATLAIVGGATMVVAGTLVMFGVRASWTTATVAFVLSFAAAAYAAWVAAPYWRGSVVVGVLAIGGLIAGWTQQRPALAGSRGSESA